MANRLKEKYLNEVVPSLTEQFNYSSVMAVPKVDKIVLNMGVGDAVSNAKNLEKAAEELALISGQKPLITKAKKSMIAKNKRPAKFSTQAYTRCERCGRPHSVYRKFKLCRVCFRELAYKGQIPGVTKASW